MLPSLVSLLALLALSAASPVERRADTPQFGPCLTAACPTINGLSLTVTNLPAQVGGDLTCLYADLTGLVNTCIFHADGSLNGGSSAQACQGFAACTSCAENYNLNAGQCVLQAAVSAPVSLPVSIPIVTVTPTILSTITKPLTTITPKVTNLISGTNTVTIKVTATVPNPLPAITNTKSLTKIITSALSTLTNTGTKTVVTGKPTKTQYEAVFPTDCCPDAYLSLSPVTSAVGGIKRQVSTSTVTALTTITKTVTEKVGTVTAAATTIKVTVPAAQITATVSVTAKQVTILKTATLLSTITGPVKTVSATVTKHVPNTGTYTSTVTPANVCPTAGVGVGVTGPIAGALTPLQQAVQATLQQYQKLSAGIDVLVLCGSKLLALKATA